MPEPPDGGWVVSISSRNPKRAYGTSGPAAVRALPALFPALALASPLTVGLAGPAHALTAEEELVEEARLTILSMLGDADYALIRPYLASAEGILILPDLYRGGVIFGAEGGEGVFLVRREDGSWSYPAFYFMGGGSFGLQIGGQISETVLTIMTERGVSAMIDRRVRVGADMSGAIIAVGGGIEAGSRICTLFPERRGCSRASPWRGRPSANSTNAISAITALERRHAESLPASG